MNFNCCDFYIGENQNLVKIQQITDGGQNDYQEIKKKLI